MTKFSKKAQHRIAKAVKWVERQAVPNKLDDPRVPRAGLPAQVLAIADQDIPQKGTGTATLAAGSTDYFYKSADREQYQCYNPGPAVTAGDEVLLCWPMWRPDIFEPMWVITPSGSSTGGGGDEIWCGFVCFWVDECCLYRGTVHRMLASDDYCNPQSTSQPAWIVHDVFEDPETGRPVGVLRANSVGWVRKIDDEYCCTYILPGSEDFEMRECLPVYEWCILNLESECPNHSQTITAKFHSSMCEKINSIPDVALTWTHPDDIPQIPFNLPDCTPEGAPGIYENGAWIGEFTVDTRQPVRLFECLYTLTGPPPQEADGAIRIHWCTGALIQLYRLEDEWVPETRPYSNIRLREQCYALYENDELVWENVTYAYRLLVACDLVSGSLYSCLEHIFPSCHPWKGEALEDASRGLEINEICINSHLAQLDTDFGTSPTGWRSGSVGWWYGTSGPQQFALHRFAGCGNAINQNCNMTENTQPFYIFYTW